MIGTLIIIIVVVVVVLALVAGGIAVTRSRRRAGGGTTAPPSAPPTAPPSPPPQAPAATTVAPAPPAAPPEAAAPLEVAEAPPTYRSRLGGVRSLFSGAVSALRAGRIDATTWDSLEEALIRADVGVTTTTALLDELRAKVQSKQITSGDDLLQALGASIRDLLDGAGRGSCTSSTEPESPTSGSSSASTASARPRPSASWRGASRPPATPSCWPPVTPSGPPRPTSSPCGPSAPAPRSSVGPRVPTPSAIVFDAVQRAVARGNDLVLADTAGRLHTKVNLVEELKKIRRVADRDPGNVTEVLLVLDATTGQNGLVQARQFADAVDVTGIVLTKLDGTAKGGIVIAVQRELFVPVKLVGLGEGPDDLVDFDPDEFVDALLAVD